MAATDEADKAVASDAITVAPPSAYTDSAAALHQLQLQLLPPFSKRTVDKLSFFVLLNARSLNNKSPELYHLLYYMQYDVIMITESQLRNSTPSSLLKVVVVVVVVVVYLHDNNRSVTGIQS